MKRVLIAPLDWGLGHATRCIPIIRYLLEMECEVIIAADARPLQLLKSEFSDITCEFIQMHGYDISYPKNVSMALKIAMQIPKILSGIKKEHECLKKIIKEKNIDAVISDNRFGLWTDEVPCAFITHQLMIKMPFGEDWIRKLNMDYIEKYTECWVPDTKEDQLSGDLANKFILPQNAKYIGALSRFSKEGIIEQKNDLLVILSGPEPQRTILEKLIVDQLSALPPTAFNKSDWKTLIVQGITEKEERISISENIRMVSHLTTEELKKNILSSEIILSRSGYSTIMDLAVLGKKAIFIPTPGQTEQEYLAEYYRNKMTSYSVYQNEFVLAKALNESAKYTGFTKIYSGDKFKSIMDEFLSKI